MTARDWIAAQEPALFERLKRFVEIPSVSTDPEHAADIARAAEFVAGHLRGIGIQGVTVTPTAAHPVVTGAWLGAAGAPTVLVYGHYDVQPPDPLDAWTSAPFVPEVRDGRLYGRGVSDDKGPLMAALGAIEALMATQGALPVNVRFLIEGAEELGSAGLEEFVVAHPEKVRADFLLSADGAMWRADLPSVTMAARGMCALNVTVTGAGKDLHSGRYGGGVPNAVQVLAGLVAGLHDASGAVAVPGFYDGIPPLDTETRDGIAALPFDEAAFFEGIGVKAGSGEAGYGFLERNWLRPTLELNGILGGYGGPGFKTIVPAQASAKISCRLVPGQDPGRILRLIEADLVARCPGTVGLSFERKAGVAWPSAVPTDHPGLRLAMDILSEQHGAPAHMVRMGATIPASEMFARLFDMPTVFFSFSTADEDYHAPNEFFRLSSWRNGLAAWTDYLTRLPAAMQGQPNETAP